MTKPYIDPNTLADAHRMASKTTERLRELGCTAEVTTDDNGLPVITYVVSPAVRSITINIDLARPDS